MENRVIRTGAGLHYFHELVNKRAAWDMKLVGRSFHLTETGARHILKSSVILPDLENPE